MKSKNEDIWGDEWNTSEEICFNCEHMAYFDDGYCLMEICKLNNEFTLSINHCDKFKNRWKTK